LQIRAGSECQEPKQTPPQLHWPPEGDYLISKKLGVALLIAFTLIIGVVALLLPRVPQPLSYHDFADQRSWLGIANFGDVSSNLLFAIAGLLGLIFLWRTSETPLFVDPRERWPYIFVFLGLFLTAFGSSYYHLAPDNARLVWDRLPMTFAFMGLVSAMLAERVSVDVARRRRWDLSRLQG